jgi:hypothetical protein
MMATGRCFSGAAGLALPRIMIFVKGGSCYSITTVEQQNLTCRSSTGHSVRRNMKPKYTFIRISYPDVIAM